MTHSGNWAGGLAVCNTNPARKTWLLWNDYIRENSGPIMIGLRALVLLLLLLYLHIIIVIVSITIYNNIFNLRNDNDSYWMRGWQSIVLLLLCFPLIPTFYNLKYWELLGPYWIMYQCACTGNSLRGKLEVQETKALHSLFSWLQH